MVKQTMKKTAQAGFTLVELAIVMIIIGLLIGGVLKGQELITNAQVTSTIAQAKGLDAATSTFRDMYAAFPGDMSNAQTRLANCAAPCNNGNGNGRLDVNVGAAPALAGESAGYFNQLRAADLLTGFDGINELAFGKALPPAAVGGGFTVGDTLAGGTPTGFTGSELRHGKYIVLNGIPDAVGDTSGVLTTRQAGQIDRKMDDGRATGGSVVVQTKAACRDTTDADLYAEGTQDETCAIAIRIQG